MDGNTLVNFLLVLFFVLLGGVFAGTEMALVSLRESQVRRMRKMGRGGARIAALVGNPSRFLSTVQIGTSLPVAYLSLVLGELVPKRQAMQNATGFAKSSPLPYTSSRK